MIMSFPSKRTKVPYNIIRPAIVKYGCANEYAPNTNYPTNPPYASNVSGWRKAACIQLDLSGIPYDADILSAVLYRYRIVGYAPNEANYITERFYRITAPWESTSVTWNTLPSRSSDYQTYGVGVLNQYSQCSIKGLITNWVQGVYPNYGFMIYPSAGAPSKEGLVADIYHAVYPAYIEVIFV